jgi:hypothetical protein
MKDAKFSQKEILLEVPEWKKKTFGQKYLAGFPLVLRAFASLTALVLLINVGWFAWAWRHYGVENGYGTIQQGDCDASQSLNRWLHLAINVLSTGVLLGSSSFLIAASAPSRQEILNAHQKGQFVSVGLFSLRNFSHIASRKVLLCIILALTSVPLHLFYNSVIFSVLSGNDYYWGVVTEDFLSGAPFNLTAAQANVPEDFPVFSPETNITLDGPTALYFIANYTLMQQDAGQTYERLSNLDCLKAYSQKLIPNRRNLVLVSSHQNSSNSILAFDTSTISNEGNLDSTNWICSNDPEAEDLTCDASTFISDPDNWNVFGFPVEYCLSEQTEGSCSIQFSSVLAIIIIVSNAVKLAVELYILLQINLTEVITSVGDAVAFFLESEDSTTLNMCLQGRLSTIQHPSRRVPILYTGKRNRWGRVISRRRWVLSITFLIVMILFVIILLGMGMGFVSSKGFSISTKNLWNLGFGKIDPEILIASDNFGSPITLSLLANLPQLILAMIYFIYNGIITSFFTAQEISSLAHKAQNLRVASPAGKQQGTWLLGMPLAWGLFFLVMQTLLHWFISQSLFVVDVAVYDEGGFYDNNFASISNCGFSPLAVICSVIMVGLLLLILFGLAMRRFPARGPPVMGNCSAAISAACHPPRRGDSEDIPYRKLQWGSVWTWPDGVGHCSFADADADGASTLKTIIREVQPGNFYI